MGNDQYKAQNYQAALKLYSEAIQYCPDAAAYYGNRSACHMMLCSYKEALSDARTSVQLDDRFEKGYVRLVKCCVILGDFVGAEQVIKKFAEIFPHNKSLKGEISICQQLRTLESRINDCYSNKEYRTVVFHLDTALKIAIAANKYKLLKAECLAYLGRVDEASDIAVTAMKIDPASVDAIFIRGLCLYYDDNLEKGILHFERVLQLDPDHSKAKLMRTRSKLLKEKKETGNAMFKSGQFRDAAAVYTEALRIDEFNTQMNSKLYYNRALVNSKIGNLRDSIADCGKVLELDSKYLKALLLRARCYNDLEKFEECVKDYETAYQIQKSADIKNLLREAKFSLKKSKRKDYYKILGVTKSATDDEIKKAYKKKAMIHHPDRHASLAEDEKKDHEIKFKEVGEAYSILSDPKKKQRFDSGMDVEDLGRGGDFFSFLSAIIAMFFRFLFLLFFLFI